MNTKKIICTITLSLALVVPAFAEVPASTAATPVALQAKTAREAVQKELEAARAASKALREGRKGEAVEKLREGARALGKQAREEAKKEVADLRADLAAKREQFKKELEETQGTLRARMQEKKDELKKNLTKIKDEKKRAIVEQVYEQMTKLNETRTTRFAEALEKLAAVLERIKGRTDKTKAEGRDVKVVEAAIAEAVKAIDVARAAVKMQAAQVYKLGVESEATLKTKAGNLRKVLHEDVKKTEEVVKAAREKVHAAAVALGATETPAPSPAPQQ